jgi:hypothetical protein
MRGKDSTTLDMLTYFKVLKTKHFSSFSGWVDSTPSSENVEKYNLVEF